MITLRMEGELTHAKTIQDEPHTSQPPHQLTDVADAVAATHCISDRPQAVYTSELSLPSIKVETVGFVSTGEPGEGITNDSRQSDIEPASLSWQRP